MKRVSIAGLCLMVLGLAGCHRNEPPDSSSEYAATLVIEAQKTQIAYAKAMEPSGGGLSHDIPEVYWADGIRALGPIRVYLHRINVVVVQAVSDDVERGKYIYIPISSYLPMTGDDGFTFTPDPSRGDTYSLGCGVFDYKRNVHD